ncbi:class I SAM-dependent methyltransferase [Roseobacter sp.]|uniref:class I SAM-dependent methyltransferase n=1 Tax=Roseobacter sp. TaxID=1907202 RepID=UPI00385F869F
MTIRKTLTCPACEQTDLLELPIPHPENSMLSDGQTLKCVLRKMSCCDCGHCFHAAPPTQEDLLKLFDENYSLGQRDPSAEVHRAELYAEAIMEFLAENSIAWPQRLVEIGCGMGSLLSLLAGRWNCQSAAGIEPSQQLATAALTKCPENAVVHQCAAEDLPMQEFCGFDLCLSVNVAEHTLAPSEFLRKCNSTVTDAGHILVICPDGEQPSSELLFYDHMSSFTDASLTSFAKQAGLRKVASRSLTGGLQGFRAHLLDQDNQFPETVSSSYQDLSKQRIEFLERWCQGCSTLGLALRENDYAIFGTGEFADLLATYCAPIVENATYFVVDNSVVESYRGKPVIDTKTFISLEDLKLVAAVHERSWPAVHKRFRSLGAEIFHPYCQNPKMGS